MINASGFIKPRLLPFEGDFATDIKIESDASRSMKPTTQYEEEDVKAASVY